jgi:hypothetical protein
MRKYKLFQLITLFLGIILPASSVQAGIEYDHEKKILSVFNYPDSFPCTPKTLFKASQRSKWDIIEYQKDSDTYIISADLHIGKIGNSDTYFQIGDKKHPETKLVVRGDIFVFPTATPQNAKTKNVNCLTLGDENNQQVKATLAIFNYGDKRRGLYISCIPYAGKNRRYNTGAGGELQVFNSKITAKKENKEGAMHEIIMAGANTRLINSNIAWVKGLMTGGLRGYIIDKTKIENTVFENGGTVFRDFSTSTDPRFKKVFKDCVFKKCGTVIDASSLKLFLENCEFTENRLNWNLTGAGIFELTDCEYGSLTENSSYDLNKYCEKRGWSTRLTSKRHIIIKAVDPDGKPVTGATVTITTGSSKQPLVAKTGNNGETPGKDSNLAILLTQTVLETTPIKNQPKINNFEYTITVNAPGFKKTVIEGFTPEKNWEEVSAVMQKP